MNMYKLEKLTECFIIITILLLFFGFPIYSIISRETTEPADQSPEVYKDIREIMLEIQSVNDEINTKMTELELVIEKLAK